MSPPPFFLSQMEIEPFKLKEEMKGRVLFEAAKECLGNPSHVSVVNSATVMTWIVMDAFYQHTITIRYKEGHESIDLNWESQSFSDDNAVCVNLKTYSPNWSTKLSGFIEKVKKPWDSWTEDELLQDPMWIYFFWRANGSIPDSFHTAMTLSGENEYVKRYFQEWQNSHPRSSPG